MMLVYLATNIHTGLRYVGATTLSLAKRKDEHRHRANCNGKKNHSRFHQAIRLHGWDAWDWLVLSECNTTTELRSLECYWIAIYDTQNPSCGYNMTRGGAGVIGYVFSDAARAKIANAGRGRVRSATTKRKISLANKGTKPSEAAMQKLRGRVWTADMRQRCSDSHKRLWAEKRASS